MPPPTKRYSNGAFTDDNSTTMDYRGLNTGTASLIGGSGISLDGKSLLLPDDAAERDDVSSLNASTHNGAPEKVRGYSSGDPDTEPDFGKRTNHYESRVQIIGTASTSRSRDGMDGNGKSVEQDSRGTYQSPTSVNSNASSRGTRKQCIPDWIVRAPCWLKFAIALSMALLTGAVVLVAVALAATLSSDDVALGADTSLLDATSNSNIDANNNGGELPAIFPPDSASSESVAPQDALSTLPPDDSIDSSTTITSTVTTITATGTTVTLNPATPVSPSAQNIIPDDAAPGGNGSAAENIGDSPQQDSSGPLDLETVLAAEPTSRPSLRPQTGAPTSIATPQSTPQVATQATTQPPTLLLTTPPLPNIWDLAQGTPTSNETNTSETATPPPTTPETQAPTLSPFNIDRTAFYVTGGRFTNEGLRNLPQQLRTLPPRGYSAFLVHLGDWNSPYATRCDRQSYQDVVDLYSNSSVPVYFLPGDNDFNDCQYPEQAMSYWHEFLIDYENRYWPSPPFWTVARHYPNYPENFAFVYDWVLYIGVNLVGGVVHDQNEWITRQDANLAWVDIQYELNRRNIDAMVVFAHADPDVSSNDRFYDTFFRRVENDYSSIATILIHRNLGVESWSATRRFGGIDNLSVVVVAGSVWPPMLVEVDVWQNRPFSFDQGDWYDDYLETGSLEMD